MCEDYSRKGMIPEIKNLVKQTLDNEAAFRFTDLFAMPLTYHSSVSRDSRALH